MDARAQDDGEGKALENAFPDVLNGSKTGSAVRDVAPGTLAPGACGRLPHPTGFAGIVGGIHPVHAVQVAAIPQGARYAELDGVTIASGFADDGAAGLSIGNMGSG